MASGVEAAGLGKLSVYSSLGQPLKAEIELVAVQKEELGAVSAKLANADAFRQARIDRAEALSGLRFSVDQRPNGQPVLKISSSTPVNDPFLDMLIELNWSSGRLIREYSILLDPPADLRPKAEAAVQPAPQPPAVAAQAEKPAKPGAPAEPAKPKPEAPPAAAEPRQYGPIKSGETLHAIAAKTKPADVSIDQMMVGLYHQNKNAFVGNNMNRLKKGAVLNLPDRDAAMMVDPARASREVRMQAADWNAYRQRLAAVAETRPAEPTAEAAAGKLVPKAEEKIAPPAAPAKDVLKLSKGEPGAARPDAKALEKIQSLEEELAAKGRALKEAEDRVAQLERTVKDMQRLLELKTQEAAKPTPAPVATPQPEPAPAPEAAAPVEPAPTPAAPAPAPKAEVPALPAPLPVPTEGPSWLSTFISNPLYIGGVVAAVLLSFLLWMMMVGNRRRQGLTNFEDSIMTGGEFKNEAVFTAGTGAAGAPTGGSALMTDFSRLGLGAIDAHEVDPIAEAEVYMAYGRDAQAEEILKEALAKDPNRHEITLKLLEIYASRKDTVAFETQASELYASLGGQPTEVWMKAAEMGASIDPDNPLYRIAPGGATVGFTAAAAAAAATAAVAEQVPEPSRQEVSEFSATGGPAESEAVEAEAQLAPEECLLDFEPAFAMPETGPSVEEVPAVEELVFDEVNVPAEEAEAPVAFAEQPALAEEPQAVEFDLGAELPGAAPEPAPAGPAGIEFEPEEMGMPEAAPTGLPEETMPGETMPQMVETPAEEMPSPAVPTAELPDLDFGGIDLELKEAVAEAPALQEVELGAPEVEFAAPAPEAAAEPSMEIDPEVWEETNTKLDLARAYLEMGDHEGAREILQEVMNDGDSKQREEAGKLLSTAA